MPTQPSRTASQVDHDVESRAFDHAHKLSLCKWRLLKMKAPKRQGERGIGNVILNEIDIETGVLKLPFAVALAEEATDVRNALRFEHQDARQWRSRHAHRHDRTSIRTRCVLD